MAASSASLAFVLLFLFRYVRLIIGIYANLMYSSIPVRRRPRYTAKDATVIVPTTFKDPVQLMTCLGSINDAGSARLLVVTANAHVDSIRDLAKLESITDVEVLGVERLNKRHQLLRGLEHVDTEIVVFADDNVIWPHGCLPELLALFENPGVGAGGPRQRVRRHASPDIWNFLGISYLERRVWNNITTQAIDGSISTLSGRTAAYRTEILQNGLFYDYFANDCWLGQRLNADDDKCLTRFVFSRGWKIAIQKSTVIETSMESGWKYLAQCNRWSRAHWRGNFAVMARERYWCSFRYVWGFYVIYLGQFQTPAALIDGLLWLLLRSALRSCNKTTTAQVTVAFASWLLFTKVVKMIPYFWRHPADMRFMPASILFSYLHGIINIYALLTLHVTSWGSQQLEQLQQARMSDKSMVSIAVDHMED